IHEIRGEVGHLFLMYILPITEIFLGHKNKGFCPVFCTVKILFQRVYMEKESVAEGDGKILQNRIVIFQFLDNPVANTFGKIYISDSGILAWNNFYIHLKFSNPNLFLYFCFM